MAGIIKERNYKGRQLLAFNDENEQVELNTYLTKEDAVGKIVSLEVDKRRLIYIDSEDVQVALKVLRNKYSMYIPLFTAGSNEDEVEIYDKELLTGFIWEYSVLIDGGVRQYNKPLPSDDSHCTSERGKRLEKKSALLSKCSGLIKAIENSIVSMGACSADVLKYVDVIISAKISKCNGLEVAARIVCKSKFTRCKLVLNSKLVTNTIFIDCDIAVGPKCNFECCGFLNCNINLAGTNGFHECEFSDSVLEVKESSTYIGRCEVGGNLKMLIHQD